MWFQQPAPSPVQYPDKQLSFLTFNHEAIISSSPMYYEFITKDGKYTATFTDPDNKWRCYVTSLFPNGQGAGTDTLTIVCAKPHEVAKEK